MPRSDGIRHGPGRAAGGGTAVRRCLIRGRQQGLRQRTGGQVGGQFADVREFLPQAFRAKFLQGQLQ